MEVVAFLLSLVAIVTAFIALLRKTEDAARGVMETTADGLPRLEQLSRGRERQSPVTVDKPPTPLEAGSHP